MISVLLISYLFYQVLILKNRFFILYYLILTFNIYSLPSSFKAYFVFQVAGSLVYPQDLLLIVLVPYLLTDSATISHIKKNRQILFAVILILALNLIQVFVAYQIHGMESYFLRQGLSGAFMYLLSLTLMDVLDDKKGIKYFGRVLIFFNLVTLFAAVVIIYFPWLNSMESILYTHIGWSVLSGQGSTVLVNAISGNICLLSIYYFLVIDRRPLLSPTVLLPIVLVIMTSHRITYISLVVLLLYALIWQKKQRGIKLTIKSIAAIHGLVFCILISLSLISNNDRFVAKTKPFFDRAMSLSDSKNVTIVDRKYQYNYFFKKYLTQYDLSTYLFGEIYKPYKFRDIFFGKVVTPHNFIIHTVVMRGFVGLFFIFFLIWAVLKKCLTQRGSPFFPILLFFMITQMTDASFTNYPFSAFLSIILALIISNSGNRSKNQNCT